MISTQLEAINKIVVDEWFAEWQKMQPAIEALHTARNKAVNDNMLAAIAHYEQFVLNASQTEATTIQPTDEFQCMPINGTERLLFIKAKPAQFACYRQLDELFKETKKRMARLRTQLNK